MKPVQPDNIATGRNVSLFKSDLETFCAPLSEQLTGKRLCIIGGAGSIGSATIDILLDYPLRELVVIDHNENALASLSRYIQTRSERSQIEHIHTLPLDFGGPLAKQFLQQHIGFDSVLNFAALKHVRSEKDPLSTLALLETNILKHATILSNLKGAHKRARYFSVSTDKAANPVSFMGASKRLMEHILFRSAHGLSRESAITSARFANVAYSQGSLLESFVSRLSSDVPLAAPKGIQRYFLSHEEAGQICVLTSLLGDAGHIYIPALDPNLNLVSMEDVAVKFLSANGYDAIIFDDPHQAIRDLPALQVNNKWPLILTDADTAGEKPFEEFVSANEISLPSQFKELNAIRYDSRHSADTIDQFCKRLSTLLNADSQSGPSFNELRGLIAEIEPSFQMAHISSGERLDDRI